MKKGILVLIVLLTLYVRFVSPSTYVQLVDTDAISRLNIYQYNVSIHNNLTGLQGGEAPNEYYHLTEAEYAELGSLVAESGDYLELSGGTMQGDINMDGNSLTNVGELIMDGLTKSKDIIPVTDDLYSLGNLTHWWSKAYVTDLYASTIATTDLTSTNIDSTNLDSVNIDSTNINGTNIESEVLEVENNITLGSFIIKDDGTDMVIILT